MTDFFETKATDLIPASLIEKLKKLNNYELSNAAKITEFQVIMENFNSSLSADDRLKLENELSNKLSDYLKDHGRELEKSGIVKIDLSKMSIVATGQVPGRALNQFSLDEYQNNLRIAVTIGQSFGLGQTESFSDVYILDGTLKNIGSVKDLGRGESIYSARFVDDRGYVVTFKQTDPFYVLDLSNPANAELKGELKIPGYSSYLHPLAKNLILGIGREQSKVKISLFDVSDPTNPTEASKYNLDEYWTAVENTHHAFLLDEKHNVFFMPGSKGGYVFSYKNNKLKLEVAVSETSLQRAIYLNDYLYIIGDKNITVFNENNWQKVKEFQF